MRKTLIFFLWCVVSIAIPVKGKSMDVSKPFIKDTTALYSGMKELHTPLQFALSDSLKANINDTAHHKKHRLVAALLAFPLGVFGLHRLYLGSSGKVPLIYIVTIGGGFGVLPFIDFVMILLSKNKDFHAVYTGNPHLFMWQKKKLK